ncbi:hypothetical protein ACFP8W_17815, partial [Nocardioides hankookensis]
MTRQPLVARRAEELLGTSVIATAPVAGGDIATSTRLRLSDGTTALMKTLPHAPEDFFTDEAEGLRVTVETCPHYLCFAAETIPDGSSQFKCCPPIRDAGNREELWQGLRSGIIDMVVSDHSPSTAEEKGRGGGDLQQAWGG